LKSLSSLDVAFLLACTFSLCNSLTANAVAQSEASTPETKAEKNRIEVLNPLTKLKDNIEISPEIAGPIKMLAITEGSRVQAGELLAQIRDDRAILRLEQARFELQLVEKQKTSDIAIRIAEKTSAVATAEYTRAEQANKRNPNTYAISEIERLRLVFEKSLLEIEKSQHDRSLLDSQILIEKTKVQLVELEVEQHRIKCPVQGMVVKVNRHPGEWIEPGSPLLELVDLESFRVEGFVSVQDAARDLYGLPATVVMPFAEDEWRVDGKVVFVSPEANPVNLQVRVILEFPFIDEEARRKFRSGLKCSVWIATSQDERPAASSPLSIP
jgi:multidrug resistance efflux pump